MVDTARQANVQALRALFAQKEKTVIDGLKASKEISKDEATQDGNICDRLSDSSEGNGTNSNRHSLSGESSHGSSPTLSVKPRPVVGPKPILQMKTKERSPSPANIKNMVAHLEKSDGMYTSSKGLLPKSLKNIAGTLNESEKSSTASLDCDNKCNINNNNNDYQHQRKQSYGTQSVLIKKERIIMTEDSRKPNLFNGINPAMNIPKPTETQISNIRSKLKRVGTTIFRKKMLPSIEVLGPPPKKPMRPFAVSVSVAPPLPQRNETQNKENGNVGNEEAPPPLPDRTLNSNRQSITPPPRPSVPAPAPRPSSRIPPLPPSNPETDCSEELYGDTVEPERVHSLIAEYTEEEECRQRSSQIPPNPPSYPPPARPKNPPPPPPASSSGSSAEFIPSTAEDYAENRRCSIVQDEIYEDIPFDEQRGPVYSNTKDQERKTREEQKRLKKELKEKEKHDKLCEKLRKKYGLTGEEIPVDDGVVKTDSKGNKTDLTVHKGETVLILRMENNPVGKWLAKNERGKIGYVELTNIEVMTVRVSQAIEEAIYNDIDTEDIYEVTY